jgi:hypothetical protein
LFYLNLCLFLETTLTVQLGTYYINPSIFEFSIFLFLQGPPIFFVAFTHFPIFKRVAVHFTF